MIHPIDQVEWRPGADLRANDWNPNVVMRRELVLLEASLLRGWVSPILVKGELIIDGYHRWHLSQTSKALMKRDAGRVPVVEPNVSMAEAIAMTVVMNRARGTHQAELMRTLAQRLIEDEGKSQAWIAKAIGAVPGEVDLLLGDAVFKRAKVAPGGGFSEAWTPEHGEE